MLALRAGRNCLSFETDFMADPKRVETAPESLADILGRMFTARGWGRKSERQQLEFAWAEVAGEDLIKNTRVLAMRRGVLEIDVRNGVLLQELTQFHKRRLMDAMRKKLPGTKLTDMKFRAGTW